MVSRSKKLRIDLLLIWLAAKHRARLTDKRIQAARADALLYTGEGGSARVASRWRRSTPLWCTGARRAAVRLLPLGEGASAVDRARQAGRPRIPGGAGPGFRASRRSGDRAPCSRSWPAGRRRGPRAGWTRGRRAPGAPAARRVSRNWPARQAWRDQAGRRVRSTGDRPLRCSGREGGTAGRGSRCEALLSRPVERPGVARRGRVQGACGTQMRTAGRRRLAGFAARAARTRAAT